METAATCGAAGLDHEAGQGRAQACAAWARPGFSSGWRGPAARRPCGAAHRRRGHGRGGGAGHIRRRGHGRVAGGDLGHGLGGQAARPGPGRAGGRRRRGPAGSPAGGGRDRPPPPGDQEAASILPRRISGAVGPTEMRLDLAGRAHGLHRPVEPAGGAGVDHRIAALQHVLGLEMRALAIGGGDGRGDARLALQRQGVGRPSCAGCRPKVSSSFRAPSLAAEAGRWRWRRAGRRSWVADRRRERQAVQAAAADDHHQLLAAGGGVGEGAARRSARW